jgi:hypothetical protein
MALRREVVRRVKLVNVTDFQKVDPTEECPVAAC